MPQSIPSAKSVIFWMGRDAAPVWRATPRRQTCAPKVKRFRFGQLSRPVTVGRLVFIWGTFFLVKIYLSLNERPFAVEHQCPMQQHLSQVETPASRVPPLLTALRLSGRGVIYPPTIELTKQVELKNLATIVRGQRTMS